MFATPGQPNRRLRRLTVVPTRPLICVGTFLVLTGCTSGKTAPAARSAPPNSAASPAPATTALEVTSNAKPLRGGWCSVGELTARYGGLVSPMTGEHPAPITVWNVSHSTCRLPTYPTVALFTGRDRLPFRFQHGGAYIQDRPGPSLTLTPRVAAHFLIATYRCDVKSISEVSRLDIKVVPTNAVTRVSFPAGYAGPVIDYCGPAASDPGNTVEVGPYVPGSA